MKKKISIGILCLVFGLQGAAQKKKDVASIKGMCGCFEVSFNFAETFDYSNDSLYKPSKNKVDKGLEWAQLVREDKNKITIQHLLQVGDPSQPYIVKHWRQDWEYENTDFYMYNGDNQWTYTSKPKAEVKGQWSQKVFQVDDSPRYEGSGSWVHIDGKSYWENTTPAPLPRREYTTRGDYNITMRGNRHEITQEGWLHDQDNEKIIRKDGRPDVVLAKEKGYNTYEKVPDAKCKGAADWWTEHHSKWKTVRSKWNTIFARKADLTLQEKVDNKVVYKYLFDDAMTTKKDIDKIIESFVENRKTY